MVIYPGSFVVTKPLASAPQQRRSERSGQGLVVGGLGNVGFGDSYAAWHC
ncbi:hypothetical protein ACWGS9_34335 [Bradyrhizobium sp. Arg314]